MISEPKLEYRDQLHTVGIRKRLTIQEFGTDLPALWDEVYGWVESKGLSAAGPAHLRYFSIDMDTFLDVEVGTPVEAAATGDERVTAGTTPAGQYATVIYTGDYPGLVSANAALLEWGEKNDVTWQTTGEGAEMVWEGRFEYYLTNPDEEPDPEKWVTEVAFLTTNGQAQ